MKCNLFLTTRNPAVAYAALVVLYSGNSIAPCCPVSGPPVKVYGSATSPPITVTLQ
jgi:hypothetical protein